MPYACGHYEPSAIRDFLQKRKDAELLIFWNAPLKKWAAFTGLESYSLAHWTLTSADLFSLSCLLNQDAIFEAIEGLFTPHMAITHGTNLPNPIAQMMSSSVLESAIWLTASLGSDPDPAKDADECRSRRRIIDRLIESGASTSPIKLLRAAYLPSNGDPMEAAKMANNQEAINAIMFARNKAEGEAIGREMRSDTTPADETGKSSWGTGVM